MATEVVLPKLGLTQEEGTIVRWVKAEGSRVTRGEPLFEVLTDKATIEVEAPASGVLLRILVAEGATAPVATPIAVIGEPGEQPAAGLSSPAVPSRAPGAAPRSAPAAGSRGCVPAASAVSAGVSGMPAVQDGRLRVSPRARALASTHGIELRALRGSGPDGRIIERDVQQALDAGTPAGVSRPAASPAGTVPPAVSAKLRAVIARRMTESLQGTAQLTLTTDVDMAGAARLREEAGAELERRGGTRPTYTDLVVRAAAIALRDHPRLNARWAGDGVRLLPDIHVGVAVALDEGLVVPVIRNADRATLAEISAALRKLSERARGFRLTPEEMDGGTFTVTNLGTYGVDAFTPIINPPEAAVLGAGRVHRRPVAVGDRVEVRPVMVLSLTFDHRVVDGAPAAQFLQRVKHVLEHPYLLLLP
ncbi:MAG TPA: dihydrolipoamide acetyltransferase family protein [bacterium]|nr:dihydrolipoamide acetyltransferase family protein [bacterium]